MTVLTDSIDAVCARYQRDHDLPADVGPGGRIYVPAGQVDAIQMPRPLGDLVRQQLHLSGIQTPIVENLGTRYLTVITNGARPDDRRPVVIGRADTHTTISLAREATFLRCAAIRTVSGAWVMLPSPDDERLAWLDTPVHSERVAFDVLVEFTLTAAARLRRQ